MTSKVIEGHKSSFNFSLNPTPSVFLEFKKILPNIFIYESILIKIYMNTNVMNTQIFHFDKYDLKGH